jgi:polar amino acid transport system substrate-binding protein
VKIRTSWLAPALVALCCAGAHAAPRELVMLAPLNHSMPVARFAGAELTGGILKDIGELLAARLGRSARFVGVPSRRVGLMLAGGEADGVCLVQKNWIDGDFDWSPELIPSGGAVLARADAPPVRRLDDLRGKKLGTVAGYRYGYLDPLGQDFLRDDAPSSEHSLRKLLAGRTQYALMELSMGLWHVRNDASHSLRLDLVYERTMARCAFSRKSAVAYADIERAIDGIIADHAVERIMARYR